MSDQNHDPIGNAADFIRAKDYEGALGILIPYLRQNPKSEDGWYLISFAIPDRDKKIEALNQLLNLNPENAQAQKRLQKLETPKTRPPAQVVEKTQKSRWPLIIILILILVVIIVLVTWGALSIFGGLGGLPPPGTSVALVATATPTPTTPLPPPSPTPSQIPTTSSSPTPQDNPSTTPTTALDLASGETADRMNEIQIQVRQIRGLRQLETVPRFVIPQERVREVLEQQAEGFLEKAQIEDERRILVALGLISPTYDLYTKILNSLGDGFGGFYVPETTELFVIGERFENYEQWVFSHEYGHALVDQHFNLAEIGIYPECEYSADQCIAIRALVEGDATLLMDQWLVEYTDPGFLAAVSPEIPTEMISSDDIPPPYVFREIEFLYGDGYNFVVAMFEEGSWEKVNSTYAALPETSEQILHPEKYIAQERAIQVELPDLASALGEDWRLLISDTLGELNTLMILGHSSDFLAHLDENTLRTAATGWGGDRFEVYHNDKRGRSILAALWEWDSVEDRVEFYSALTEYQNRRFRGNDVETAVGQCWELFNEHLSCIYSFADQTLWLLGPDAATVDLIYSSFPIPNSP